MIEVKIHSRHDILNEVVRIVSHANEKSIPITSDEFGSFLSIYLLLYPSLYIGIEIFAPDGSVTVYKRDNEGERVIICELIFPTP